MQATGGNTNSIPDGCLRQVQGQAGVKRDVVLKPPDEIQCSLRAGQNSNVIQVRKDVFAQIGPDIKLQIPHGCTQA